MVREMGIDAASKLGTYYRLNPTFETYVPNPQYIMEIESERVTRFRTGSHSFSIELGRYANIPRENRVCKCGNFVHSILHVFMECPLTHSFVITAV